MNSLFIVLPILTILMFDLGLTLEGKDFRLVMLRYKAVLAGMIGQLLLLPLIAWGVAGALSLSPLFTIGLMLIVCCPGGSSSNVFSMLAKGDVALSVSLTAVSSLITLFTVPLIMQATTAHLGEAMGVKLPVVNLLMQNVVTMLLPILLGIGVRHYWRETARKIERVLSRLAFPALMLLAGIFFVQHKTTIADNFGTLGLATTLLLLCATKGRDCSATYSACVHRSGAPSSSRWACRMQPRPSPWPPAPLSSTTGAWPSPPSSTP